MKPAAVVIAGVLLVGGIGAFSHVRFEAGYAAADSIWSQRWDKRDKYDAEALAQRQKEERDEEQRRTKQVAAAAIAAGNELSAARADADAADAAAGGLRESAAALAQRLAESQARCNSATARQREAEARTALVLADMLSRIDERAGDLAAEADRRTVAGNMCERLYNSLSN